jgi:hypothetical protein
MEIEGTLARMDEEDWVSYLSQSWMRTSPFPIHPFLYCSFRSLLGDDGKKAVNLNGHNLSTIHLLREK